MGLPKIFALLSVGHAQLEATKRIPQARAATFMRPTSTPSIIWEKPWPGSPPRIWSAPILRFSRIISVVSTPS